MQPAAFSASAAAAGEPCAGRARLLPGSQSCRHTRFEAPARALGRGLLLTVSRSLKSLAGRDAFFGAAELAGTDLESSASLSPSPARAGGPEGRELGWEIPRQAVGRGGGKRSVDRNHPAPTAGPGGAEVTQEHAHNPAGPVGELAKSGPVTASCLPSGDTSTWISSGQHGSRQVRDTSQMLR